MAAELPSWHMILKNKNTQLAVPALPFDQVRIRLAAAGFETAQANNFLFSFQDTCLLQWGKSFKRSADLSGSLSSASSTKARKPCLGAVFIRFLQVSQQRVPAPSRFAKVIRPSSAWARHGNPDAVLRPWTHKPRTSSQKVNL